MRSRNMRSTATSTSVTRSVAPFLSMRMVCPNRAICRSPARTTASTAVVRNSGLTATRQDALQHADLHAAFRRPLKLDVVHEVADEEDPTAARLQQVLGRQRIRHRFGIESLALIAHANRQLRQLALGGLKLD